jgi:CRISPR system Cascade subunit CasA
MTSFNLIDQPFIPVSAHGTAREVGIREALLDAHTISEVQATSPLETAALMRLLLCIAHAACGPVRWQDTRTLLREGQFSADAVTSYLDKWCGHFDLFGGRAFLQVGDLTMSQAAPLTALATESATGNNATLFDHATDADPPAFTPAEAARKLLAAQAFALGFGRAADATLGEQPFPRPYLADAICLRGVTVWLSGRNLFETLVLNMVPRTLSLTPPPEKPEERPLWEQADRLERLDRVLGKQRITVRSHSVMDRYVWQSRLVRLLPETDAAGRTVVRRAYFTQGREADKSQGDPMKVFIESKTEGIYALGLNAGKASWRDLHSLLSFNTKVTRNPIFNSTAKLVENEVVPKTASYGLNVVGLATDPGKAGKFLLWRHDRLPIPAAFLEDETLVALLARTLRDAEFVAGELGRRTYAVAKSFVPPHGNPDPKDVARLANALDARPAYWARLESHFMTLLVRLPEDETAAIPAWRGQVEREAERALRETCRQLGQTPQAIRAKAAVSFRFQADEQAVMDERAERKKKAETRKKEEKKHERIAR